MENSANAILIYGIRLISKYVLNPSLDENIISNEKWNELQYVLMGNSEIEMAYCGKGFTDNIGVFLCVSELGYNEGIQYSKALGEKLPVALPNHREVLLEFCKKHDIPVEKDNEPQWHLLALYI